MMNKLAISCILLLFFSAVASLAVAQSNETLLFVSDRGDGKTFQIYSMAPDGSNQKTITLGDATEVDPVVSPDGTRIAFVLVKKPEAGPLQSSILVMKRDGSGRTKLSDDEEQAFGPAWSPDGKRIAYSAFRRMNPSRNGTVIVVDADGRNRNPIGAGLMPSWSACGKQVACSVFKDGRPIVHMMDTNGNNVNPLTKGVSMMAVWSPDGKRIAYIGESGDDGSDQPDLFVMNADGSEVKQLTKTLVAELAPVWSADGKRIYFTRYSKFIGDEAAIVVVIDLEGTQEHQLTDGKSRDFTGGSSLIMTGRSKTRTDNP